jgi:O-antigen ligase
MILIKTINTLSHQIRIKSLHSLNYIIVLFAFVMPLHRDLGKLTIILMIIAFLFSLDVKKCYSVFVENRVLQILIVFIVYISVSILFSENKLAGLELVYLICKYLFVVVLITIVSLDEQYIEHVITAFLFSMFINMIATYYMFFYSIESVFGLEFTEPNSYFDYSIFAAFSIFLCLYRFLKENNASLKFLYFIFISAMIVNLFISHGRTGQLVFILSSFIMILIFFKDKIKKILYLLALIIFILILAYGFSEPFNGRINLAISEVKEVVESANYKSSIGMRLYVYKLLPGFVRENNILFGSGIGDLRDMMSQKYIQEFGTWDQLGHINGQIHNTFIGILISLGVVGLSIFIYFLYSILKLELLNNKLEILKYSFVFTMVFTCFSDNLLDQRWLLMLFALFFSILVVSSKKNITIEQNKEQERFLVHGVLLLK